MLSLCTERSRHKGFFVRYAGHLIPSLESSVIAVAFGTTETGANKDHTDPTRQRIQADNLFGALPCESEARCRYLTWLFGIRSTALLTYNGFAATILCPAGYIMDEASER